MMNRQSQAFNRIFESGLQLIGKRFLFHNAYCCVYTRTKIQRIYAKLMSPALHCSGFLSLCIISPWKGNSPTSQGKNKFDNFHVNASHIPLTWWIMMSSHGNIFRVTGPLQGNPLVRDGFPSQRPVTRNFDVSFDLRLNKWLSKRSRRWRFETPSRWLWRHCNDNWLYFGLGYWYLFVTNLIHICIFYKFLPPTMCQS